MPALPVFVLVASTALPGFADEPRAEGPFKGLANRPAKITETFEGRDQAFGPSGDWSGDTLGVVVTFRNVPLRTRSENISEITRVIPAGVVTPVFDVRGEWLKINYEGSQGWVNIGDVKLGALKMLEDSRSLPPSSG